MIIQTETPKGRKSKDFKGYISQMRLVQQTTCNIPVKCSDLRIENIQIDIEEAKTLKLILDEFIDKYPK